MMNRVADFLGLNRAAAAVLVVIGCLGLAEEIWANFLAIHLKNTLAGAGSSSAPAAVAQAALYMGVIASIKNLLEGVGYIAGGRLAHHLGPRVALAMSAAPMILGFTLMLAVPSPWAIAAGALLMTNWEPLSVPATFEVVGATVTPKRRTTAFALQSIQKRLPKVIGPAIGGVVFGAVGYWGNLALAFGLVGLAVVLQLALTSRLRPRDAGGPIAAATAAGRTFRIPPALRRLLMAEIFVRWGDWFARDFAVLYVVTLLVRQWGWREPAAVQSAGGLLSLMAITALATYLPTAKWVDRSVSPKPFIAVTFLLFSLFPICLVLLPRLCAWMGWPVMAGLGVAFLINGLREFGEPARKALITAGFPPESRARGVGLYWGLRSFAFFPAPIVAAILWRAIGPDATFLIGGAIGLVGTATYLRR